MRKLFYSNNKTDYHLAYKNILEEKSPLAVIAKEYYQTLYERYIELLCEEPNFLDGVQKQWYPRIWEKVLGVR